MNDEHDSIIYCSRCGAEMKSSSRYCMKCGNLNYDHEENKNFKQYQPKEEQQIYQIGSGNSVFNSNSLEKQKIQIATNNNNNKTCFLVNYISYLVLLLVSLYYCFHGVYTLDSILYSSFSFIMVMLSLFFLNFYAIQLLFVKCDKKWWYALIPIYNCIILADIVFHKKYLGLLLLIPGINIIFSFVLFFKLGKKFEYNGLLTMLFPSIMILFIGFGIHTYEGRTYINYNDKKSIERYYKYRKIFLGTDLLILFVGCLLFIFSDISTVRKKIPFFGDDYYIYVAQQVVNTIKKDVEKGKVICNDSNIGKGVYYFNYYDAEDETFLLLYFLHDPMRISVMVDTTGEDVKYFVALTDGKKGFKYTSVDNLSSDIIIENSNIDFAENVTMCQTTR